MILENSNVHPAPAVRPGHAPQPTLQRIADQSGLSVTTVSRVLSGQASRYRISKATEIAVRKLAKESSFVPNQLARSLRLKKTLTIGLVIPDISNPFFAGIAHQVIANPQARLLRHLVRQPGRDRAGIAIAVAAPEPER